MDFPARDWTGGTQMLSKDRMTDDMLMPGQGEEDEHRAMVESPTQPNIILPTQVVSVKAMSKSHKIPERQLAQR